VIDLAEEWRRIQWVPDRRPISDWAADNVTLPPTLTFSGKFDPSISRHFIAPLDSLKSDRVREVNILAPPRTGKTLIADVFAPWAIAQDPGPLLWVFAVDDQARLHCETRLMPILHACEAVQSLLPENRHKDRSTEIQLANGYPVHVKGPAFGNLQARGYRYLIGDELWLWPHGRLGQAKTRLGDFRRNQSDKFLGISQGGETGGEWWQQYTAGTVHEWEVPCDACGVYQRPVFSGKHDDSSRYGIVFAADKRADGSYDIEGAKASTRYVCQFCGHEHKECKQTQGRWNALGRYTRVEGGSSESHSYHWNDVICAQWRDLVALFLAARVQSKRGNWKPLVDFTQKQLAEFANERTVAESENPLQRVEMSASEEWPDEAFRFMAVDTQHGHFHVMARAWAKTGESRRLHWGQVKTPEEIEALRIAMNIKPRCVIIDAAWNARMVYTWAANYDWVCIRGDARRAWKHKVAEPGKAPTWVEKPWSLSWWGDPDSNGLTSKGKKALAFFISKPSTADRLQALRDSGLWVEPKVEPMTKVEQDYTDQLNSMMKIRKKPGEPETWEQVGCEPHAWDVARMQVFAAMAKGVA